MSRVTLALDESTQLTKSVPITPTKPKRLDCVIDEYPDELRLGQPPSVTACQPFSNHPSAKWYKVACDPRSFRIWGRWVQGFCLLEKTHRSVYRDHLVVVREVDIKIAIEWEGTRRGVEGSICLCPVAHR